eukprot:5925368-Amphidinium_carterae.1
MCVTVWCEVEVDVHGGGLAACGVLWSCGCIASLVGVDGPQTIGMVMPYVAGVVDHLWRLLGGEKRATTLAVHMLTFGKITMLVPSGMACQSRCVSYSI